MDIKEQQTICQNAFLDVINYFASECPNMLTFYNMFKTEPTVQLQTIRINVQDDAVPVLEYNPNWIEKCYSTNKFFLIYAVYSEMLKFILHHTTKRAAGPHTACASFAITNCRETRATLNFLPQELREPTIALLETFPCHTWLDARIAPDVVPDKDFVLEKVESILGQFVTHPDKFTEVNSVSTVPTAFDCNSTFGSDPNFVLLPLDTHPLDDYYSIRGLYENGTKWSDNPTINESVTRTYEKTDDAGWGPGMGERLAGKIKLANERKADVTSILARLRGKITSRKTEASRMKPNRRFPDDWRYMGNRHKFKSSVLFANDFSGSMSLESNLKAYSIFTNFLKESKFEYCSWDTVCSKPETWTGKLSGGDELVSTVSGGGTDPACIGEMLEEEDKHYDCVILFTDCIWQWEKRNIPFGTQLVVISCRNNDSLRNLPDFVDFSLTLQDLIGND